MNHQSAYYEHTSKRLRWIARILGTLIVLFWLFVVVINGIVEPSKLGTEDITMLILIVGTTIGVLVAWRSERIGGFITLLFGITHSIFALIASGHNHLFAMLISGGPFILIGILFLIADAHSKKSQILKENP